MSRGSVGCYLLLVVYVIVPGVTSFEEYRDGEQQSVYHLEGLEELLRIRRALPNKNSTQPSGEPCNGYSGQKGRCLPLESCVLQPLKENYIKYKAYYCIYQQSNVGVCCPNAIAVPEVYNENSFQSQGTSSRRRSSRNIVLDEQQKKYQRYRRALPPKNNSRIARDQACSAYNGQKGRCLPLENCVLQPLKENYIKYKGYYCIHQQSSVGVCCPNAIAIPETYNENSFQQSRSSNGRRRSSRDLMGKNSGSEQSEADVTLVRSTRALPVASNSSKFTGPTCYGQKQKGRCLPLENCVLKPLKENYIKNKGYYCMLRKSEVGVCCPNTIEKPEIYNPETFSSRTQNNRAPRDVNAEIVSDETLGYLGEFSRNRRAVLSYYKSHQLIGKSCFGYAGQKGRCLPLERCVLQPLKENYIKYQDYYCPLGKSETGVCCPNAVAIPEVYNETTFYSQYEKPKKTFMKKFRHRRNIKDELNECGRNGRLLSQVLKNQPVENKAWPWAVTIINADTKEHHCGATLVSRYHILSAAHCFYYGGAYVLKERIMARLGEYDFKKQDDSRFNDYSIANLIVHEDYDDPIHENDIAMLILERPARYNIYVQPACMPVAGEVYENNMAVVVGWGKVEFGGKSSSVLREVQVPVWEHGQCANSYTQTVFTTNVCAAAFEGGKDACQGDSGGPLLVQREDGRWKVIGIVSWGIQCAVKGKPGIYTQINKYLDWITEKTNG